MSQDRKDLKRQFRKSWRSTGRQLKKSGMSDEKIAMMFDYDFAQYRADQQFEAFECLAGNCTEDDLGLLDPGEDNANWESFMREIVTEIRDDIDLEEVDWKGAIKQFSPLVAEELSDDDKKMMTMVFKQGVSMREVSRRLGRGRHAVAHRIRRIGERIRNDMGSAMQKEEAI